MNKQVSRRVTYRHLLDQLPEAISDRFEPQISRIDFADLELRQDRARNGASITGEVVESYKARQAAIDEDERALRNRLDLTSTWFRDQQKKGIFSTEELAAIFEEREFDILNEEWERSRRPAPALPQN